MPTQTELNFRSRQAMATAFLHVLLQIGLLVMATIVFVKYPPQQTNAVTVVICCVSLLAALAIIATFHPAITVLDFALKFWTRTMAWMLIMEEYPLLRQRPLYRQVRADVWNELDKHFSEFHMPMNREWQYRKYLSRRFWMRRGKTLIRLWGWIGIAMSLIYQGYSEEQYKRLWMAVQDMVHLEAWYAEKDGSLSDAVMEAVAMPVPDPPALAAGQPDDQAELALTA